MLQNNSEVFKDAPWYKPGEENVIVGGAGGIGSYLAYFLVRAGIQITIYDDDILEERNIGGQLYSVTDVGKKKVNALSTMIYDFTGEQINSFAEKFDAHSPGHYYMFSAFDNMLARRHMFDVWENNSHSPYTHPLFIDGRLSMEMLQIFCVTPDTADRYEKHLFDDSKIPDAPCSMKQTSHVAAMISSYMTSFFLNHLTNVYEKVDARDVPFSTEIFLPLNLNKEVYEVQEETEEKELETASASSGTEIGEVL